MSKLKTIWKNRKQILEGVKNNMFKSEDVEVIAESRIAICNNCPHIDLKGSQCMAPGTQPCCSKCGCSLKFKVRSLSSDCGDSENPRWKALLSHEEEISVKDSINYEQ